MGINLINNTVHSQSYNIKGTKKWKTHLGFSAEHDFDLCFSILSLRVMYEYFILW